jgi:hypothetical protein
LVPEYLPRSSNTYQSRKTNLGDRSKWIAIGLGAYSECRFGVHYPQGFHLMMATLQQWEDGNFWDK